MKQLGQHIAQLSPSSIWITDAVLEHAWARFVCPQRRHGSSVPGPLEARRRSAKRRMTELAGSAGGGGHIDSALLMGMDTKRQWGWNPPEPPNLLWEPPRSKTALDSKLQNPSEKWKIWLPQIPYQPEPTAFEEINELKPDVLERSSPKDQRKQYKELHGQWLGALQSCSDIQSIRNAASLNTIPLEVPNYSCLAFLRLIALRRPIPELLEFLNDKSMNPPRAPNALHLLRYMDEHIAQDAHFHNFETWVEKETALGSLDERFISIMLHYVSRSTHSTTQQIFNRICEGIRASAVRGIRDILPETFEALVEAGCHVPQTEQVIQHLSIIIKTRYESNKSQTIASIINTMQPFCNNSKASNIGTLTHILDHQVALISSLPAQAITGTIFRILKHLIDIGGPNSDKWRVDRRLWMEEWLNALAKNKLLTQVRRDIIHQPLARQKAWEQLEVRLARLVPGAVGSYLSSIEANDEESCSFLTRHLHDPAKRARHVKTIVDGHSLRSRFSRREKKFNSEIIPSVQERAGPYQNMIETLQETEPFLLNRAKKLTMPLLCHLDRSEYLLPLYQHLSTHKSLPSTRITSSIINSQALSNPTISSQLFYMDPRLQLNDCIPYTRALATAPASRFNTVELRYVLRRDTTLFRKVPRAHLSPAERELLPLLSQKLHKVAHAQALDPDLTPRKALRAVKATLNRFCRRPELLQPEMSQAFAKAAFIRHLEIGNRIPVDLKEWVLGMMEDLEGKQTADEVRSAVWEWEASLNYSKWV